MRELIGRAYGWMQANRFVIASAIAVLGAQILQNEVDLLLRDKQSLSRELLDKREELDEAERQLAERRGEVDLPAPPDDPHAEPGS